MVRNRTRTAGFTLLELVMSLAIFSVLLGGMSAAVLIAMRAIPDSQSAVSRFIQGGEITQQILTELREAKHFTERGANAVAFTVADRDGDGSPERIRYAWSNTAGDPLTRRYNGGSVVNVLENVYKFNLSYDTKDVTEEYPGPLIESSVAILTQYASLGDSDFVIQETDWVGQYFDPGTFLPPEAASWSITNVQFLARQEGQSNGWIDVQLRDAEDDHTPRDQMLWSELKKENDLAENNYEWVQMATSGNELQDMNPNQALCLVIGWDFKPDAAAIQYLANGGSDRVETFDAGSSWINEAASVMPYKIWGTYKATSPPQTATRQYVTGVGVSLQVGDDSAARIDTAVRTLNTPEVLLAYWELDFDSDPRTVDMNGDGMGDWNQYAGPFDPATLINGIWYAPFSSGEPGISTVPDEDFAELTTVEIRYRATSVGGWGADFWINADRQGGQSANLIANLRKPTAGSQELRIGHELAGETYEWLGTYDVPDDFVDVRLVIDPAKGTFAVFVDGAHKDTFTYWWGNNDPEAKAWVYRWNCSAEFDHVSVRVGGNN